MSRFLVLFLIVGSGMISNSSSADDSLALMQAIYRGDLAAVKQLVQAGAPVNGTPSDNNGYPIIAAITVAMDPSFADTPNGIAVLEYILSQHPDMNVVRNDGTGEGDTYETPFTLAIDCALMTEVLTSQEIRLIDMILAAGADPNFFSPKADWGPALTLAGANPYSRDVVDFLLTVKNIDVNLQDNMQGWTELMKAASYGWEKEVRTLLQMGADRTIKSNAGVTALEVAQSNLKANPNSKVFQDIVALLQ